jgi:hypothetical protein
LYDACDCTYKHPGTNSTDSDTSSCSFRQSSDGCIDRYSQFPPVTVQYFGTSRICITRSGPIAVKRAEFDEDTSTCPTGHRVCGKKDGSGTIDNRICWPTTEANCPVTDIGFSRSGNERSAFHPLFTLLLNLFIFPFCFTPIDLTSGQSGADGKQTNAARDVAGVWLHLYWKNGGILNSTYFGVGTQRSAGSQLLAGLPIVNIDFKPNNPCTLGGCGYSGVRSVDLHQSMVFKSRYPREGFMIRGRCSGILTNTKGRFNLQPS